MQNRLQPVGQQQRVQLIDIGTQGLHIVTAHIEPNAQRIELVTARHLPLHGFGVFLGELGLRGITHCGPFDLGDVITREVLRLGRQGQHHHGVFRKSVEQREDVIAGLALGRHVTDLRRPTQSLDGHQRVRQIIKPPGRRGIVRVRHRQRQALGKIMPEWQVFIPRIGGNLQ